LGSRGFGQHQHNVADAVVPAMRVLLVALLLPCLLARGLVLSSSSLSSFERAESNDTDGVAATSHSMQKVPHDVSSAQDTEPAAMGFRKWLFMQLSRPLTGGSTSQSTNEPWEHEYHGHALEDPLWAEPEAFLVRTKHSGHSLHAGISGHPLLALFNVHAPSGLFAGREWMLFWILAIINYGVVVMLCAFVWKQFLGAANEDDMMVPKTLLDFILNEEKEEEDLKPTAASGLGASLISALGVKMAKKSQLHKRVRELYYEDNWEQVIRSGARTLFFATFFMFSYRLLRLTWSPSCIQPYYVLRVLELLSLVLILSACLYTVQYPKKLAYTALVLFFFFYIPAITLPPFMWSCCELETACTGAVPQEAAIVRHGTTEKTIEKIFTEERYVADSVMEVDCSLQGQTAQQMFMTWLLLLPWIIPTFNLLLLTWGWVWGIYLGWTVIWNLVHLDIQCEQAYHSYQVVLRLILLSATLMIALRKKTGLEKAQELKYMAQMRLNEGLKKQNYILKWMMPKHIADRMIANPDNPPADNIECVSILFVVVEGFDEYAKNNAPRDVLRYLNTQFTRFDKICQIREVTKIESVKEEYVCCVGVLPRDIAQGNEHGHKYILKRLFEAADDMLSYASEEDFQVKMGMHTGPIVAGVIGQKLPRYRLFGDTINTTARMMQKGEAGQLQFGAETYKNLPDQVKAKDNGLVEMKGKGKVQTYRFDRITPSEDVDAPSSPNSPGGFSARDKGSRKSFRGRTQAPGTFSQKLLQLSGADMITQTEERQVRESISEFGRLQELETLVHKHKAGHSPKGLMRSVLSNLFPHMLNREGSLDAKLEEAWYIDFHNTQFARKITGKLDKTVAMLTVWSVVHASVMVCLKAFLKQITLWNGVVDVTCFIVCRGLQISILVALRQAAKRNEDFRNNPLHFQTTTLLCYVAVAFLSYMSFQALTYHPEKIGGSGTFDFGEMQAPIDQFFSLVFMLEYCILTARHPFLFRSSLAFLALAIVLMTSADTVARTLGMRGGLYFPMMGEFLFIVIAFINSINCYEAELGSKADFQAKHNVQESKSTIDNILDRLMPTQVLQEMVSEQSTSTDLVAAPADQTGHRFQRATIAQSDLCGFTKLASKRSAQQVVNFISELFAEFDELTDKYGIYKIETVGDAYIAGKAEHTLTEEESAYGVVLFGLEMIDAVQVWAKRKRVKVNCRVGVHHGECIGGVVGTEMQRYHIFGELMSGLEILESTSEEGRVQISKACKAAIDQDLKKDPAEFRKIPGVDEWLAEDVELILKERDVPKLVTSKGESFELEEVGGKTYLVSASYI